MRSSRLAPRPTCKPHSHRSNHRKESPHERHHHKSQPLIPRHPGRPQLRSRVAGWMWNICNGMPWVVVTNTADGKTITGASSMEYGQAFDSPRMAYATKVAAYLNRECAHGGAWLAAWIGTEQFILLWKDQDGDLQIQNSCDVARESIRRMGHGRWSGPNRRNKPTASMSR